MSLRLEAHHSIRQNSSHMKGISVISTLQGSQSPNVTAQARYPFNSRMIVKIANGFFKIWAMDSRDTIRLPSVEKNN